MKKKDVNHSKQINSELFKINKNEYFVQQISDLKSAMEMGLTKSEFELICNKIHKTPNKTELGIFSAMLTEY